MRNVCKKRIVPITIYLSIPAYLSIYWDLPEWFSQYLAFTFPVSSGFIYFVLRFPMLNHQVWVTKLYCLFSQKDLYLLSVNLVWAGYSWIYCLVCYFRSQLLIIESFEEWEQISSSYFEFLVNPYSILTNLSDTNCTYKGELWSCAAVLGRHF